MQKQHLPKISIITPSYNQGRFIKETIDSVLSQNYPNLEYWVMDGGSTDDTVKVLKSYGKKINWVSKKDKGQTNAINEGLKKVTGDIVAYINSDDVYAPNVFSQVADFFVKNPEAMWYTGDYIIIDEFGKPFQNYVILYKNILRNYPTFSKLSVANYIIQPSTFWRRSLHKEIGVFDESLRYCMDYDFWLRAITKYPLFVTKTVLSKFRIHGLSKGGSQYEKQFKEEHVVLKRYTNNKILLALHKIHSQAIIFAYKLIK